MTSSKDDDLFQELPELPELPPGVDRRTFLMRNAAIGAAAVMTGTTWTPEARAQQAANGGGARRRQGACDAQVERRPLARPRCRQEVQRPGDDPRRRVLQGRSRSLELAHHRADAHHLRLLPALHETAGRSAGAGDRPQGASVRQPERHRQGPRHGTRRARGPRRQGAGHRRSALPRRDDRQAAADLSGEARRQDLQSVARGYRLRLAEGRFPARRTP